MSDETFSPPKLAERWASTSHHVGKLIQSGELKGFDISLKSGGKPRWNILLSDVLEFESRRSAKPAVKAVRRNKKKRDPEFIEYF